MSSDYIQADESILPVIDSEKHRDVKGYIQAVWDAPCGDVHLHYDMGSCGGDAARKLIGGYREPSRLTATKSMRHTKTLQASE